MTEALPGQGRLFLDQADGDLLGRRACAWLAMHRVEARELADAIGASRSVLSRALHGRRPFPVGLALQVCWWTGLRVNGNSVTFNPACARQPSPSAAAGPPAGPRPVTVAAVTAALASAGRPLSAPELAQVTGIHRSTILTCLYALLAWDRVTSTPRGQGLKGGLWRMTPAREGALPVPSPAGQDGEGTTDV